MEKANKPIYKKWWFWVIVILVIGIIANPSSFKKGIEEGMHTNTNIEESKTAEKYTIIGGELGEFGKEIILNKDTDMPSSKYLYKLPAGNYTVTTTNNKYSTISVVKDEIIKNDNNNYPEELSYVGEQYMLTASNDDLNGRAKKSIDITLNEDESFLVLDKEELIFEKK